jgi:hypothetical protein
LNKNDGGVGGGSQRQREREGGREGGRERQTVFWRDNLFCFSSLVFSLSYPTSMMNGKGKKREDETISLPDSLSIFPLLFDIVVSSSLVMVTNIVKVEKNR